METFSALVFGMITSFEFLNTIKNIGREISAKRIAAIV